MPIKNVTIPIEKYRTDASSRRWELPPWGHPFGQGIFPLCITFNNHLHPVGTAFSIGRGVTFIASAAHNIRETWSYEARLTHLLTARDLPKAVELKEAGICVLYHRPNNAGGMEITLWPLENVQGAPPTDVVFGFPQFQGDFPTLVNRLSFDLPTVGEKIWSVGYADFCCSKGGIPLAAVRDGSFNWERDYAHKLLVVEGFVERIFTQRFAKGFVEGPCFTFDAEIAHAQSGGPILSPDGTLRGINSAGASHFFDRPTSIGSLFFPLLFIDLKFGAQIGPIRLNATRPLADMIGQGIIPTDGSEERVGVGQDQATGSLFVNPRSLKTMAPFVHDDFAGFQAGKTATRDTRETYRLKRRDTDAP
jgi:hypothetical protein